MGRLDRADAALAAARCAGTLSDAELLDLVESVEAAGRALDAARVMLAGELDARSDRARGPEGVAARLGRRSGAEALASIARVRGGEARARVRLARDLRGGFSLTGEPIPARFPVLADALADGTVSTDAATAIAAELAPALPRCHPDDVGVAERALVASAAELEPDLLRVQARVWATRLDQDGVEPRVQAAAERRAFRLGPVVDGVARFSGVCDAEAAAVLRQAIEARTTPGVGPRFRVDGDAAGGLDDGIASSERPDDDAVLVDRRTRVQRDFDAFFEVFTAGVLVDAKRMASLGTLVSVVATTTVADLESTTGLAWLAGVDEPVPASRIAEWTCNEQLETAVLGESGRMLALGRRERTFDAAQRRAMLVRDGGHCVWPGCWAPGTVAHAHHVREWVRDDGPTDVDNGVLLCRAHHRLLHTSGAEIRMIDGLPHWKPPPDLRPAADWTPIGDHLLHPPMRR